MTCAACAVSVESMLKNTEGVSAASVNYANQTALVEYDPGKVAADMVAAFTMTYAEEAIGVTRAAAAS